MGPTRELDIIKNIADKLVEAFLEDLQGAVHTDGCQKAALMGWRSLTKLS